MFTPTVTQENGAFERRQSWSLAWLLNQRQDESCSGGLAGRGAGSVQASSGDSVQHHLYRRPVPCRGGALGQEVQAAAGGRGRYVPGLVEEVFAPACSIHFLRRFFKAG